MKITKYQTKYIVEFEGQHLHILSEKALRWNLKHLFKGDAKTINAILGHIHIHGYAELQYAA